MKLDLEKIEQIEVARSFSRTKQYEAYEPINAFASFKVILKPGTDEQDVARVSRELQAMAEKEVDKHIEDYINTHKLPF